MKLRQSASRSASLATFVIATLLSLAPGAQAATEDPLFVFVPNPPKGLTLPPLPPPYGNVNGPCGMAVDSSGNFYVSDYYRHDIDIWGPNADYTDPNASGMTGYIGQLADEDPIDGPCGLDFDASNNLYVNNYHRNVVKFGPLPSFGGETVFPLPTEETSQHLPTGVAVDPVGERVYVDERTYVEVFALDGTPVMEGAQPLRIGVGSLKDGYGLAFSQYPGTFGRIYVPDAGSETVKIYDPGVSLTDPVAEIDGSATPEGKFVSLRDAAIAVDRVSGDVYVVDDLQPRFTEKPQAIVYVFDATGAYLGHLKYKVGDAKPVGLAVDNSPAFTYPAGTQGRVYVTSGNTESAAIYAYRPGAATMAPARPSSFSLNTASAGSGSGSVYSSFTEADCVTSCESDVFSGAAVSLTAQPDPGSSFTGWSGTCSGDSPSCLVQVDESASAKATFAPVGASEESSAPSASPQSVPQTTGIALKRKRHRAHRRRHHRHRHEHRRGRAQSSQGAGDGGAR